MNREQVEVAYDAGKLDAEYAEYIMEHAAGDRVICNGDTLTAAMEDQYLLEDFLSSKVTA